jgi:hypothetical protein
MPGVDAVNLGGLDQSAADGRPRSARLSCASRREFFATFGNKARPRLSGGSRWGGQRRPECLSKRGSVGRSARGALVMRLRIRTVIGVQFWSTNLTRDWIWVNLQLTIEAEGPRVLAA